MKIPKGLGKLLPNGFIAVILSFMPVPLTLTDWQGTLDQPLLKIQVNSKQSKEEGHFMPLEFSFTKKILHFCMFYSWFIYATVTAYQIHIELKAYFQGSANHLQISGMIWTEGWWEHPSQCSHTVTAPLTGWSRHRAEVGGCEGNFRLQCKPEGRGAWPLAEALSG